MKHMISSFVTKPWIFAQLWLSKNFVYGIYVSIHKTFYLIPNYYVSLPLKIQEQYWRFSPQSENSTRVYRKQAADIVKWISQNVDH